MASHLMFITCGIVHFWLNFYPSTVAGAREEENSGVWELSEGKVSGRWNCEEDLRRRQKVGLI